MSGGPDIAATLASALRLHGAGRLADAERLYRDVLDADPANAEAWHLLGVIAYQRRDAATAVDHIRKAIALAAGNAAFFSNLGLALQAQGELPEAVASFRRALELKPDYADAAYNLGNALHQAGQLDAAAESYQRATALAPDFAEAHYNLATVLRRLHRLNDAAESYRRVLALRPELGEAHNNLGNILQEQNRLDDAVAAYERALSLKPDFANAWNNLGNALQEKGRLAEAEAAFRRVLALDAGHFKAHLNLALSLQAQQRHAEALFAYDEALAIDPGHADARLRRFNLKLHMCDWSTLEADAAAIKAAAAAAPEAAFADPYFLIFVPGVSAAEQRRTAATYARQRFQAFRDRPRPDMPPARRRAGRRLRIGYLSTDFHAHATAYLLAEVIELHDRRQVEAIAYSLGPDDTGDMRLRLVAAFDAFHDLRPLSDGDAASRIATDEIDILIDLKGYTGGSRAEILALRPAPIQASYLGHPGTTGADFIDYLIADRFICPPESAADYTEALACLPHCYQPNDRQRPIADAVPSRAELGLPEHGFVFCAFNAGYKITPKIFDVWMALLRDIPGSVLWLIEESGAAVANLRREATTRGVAPERLVFAAKLPLAQHLARYRRADLFLDTLPCSAHTTASDALWAGLPVLTCAGDTFAGRVGASIVRAAGLADLIVNDFADYACRARHLGAHPDEVAALRRRLAEARATCPLFDSEHYTRDLEALYRRMWQRYVAGAPPVPLDLSPEEDVDHV